jgi:hypothetical protein
MKRLQKIITKNIGKYDSDDDDDDESNSLILPPPAPNSSVCATEHCSNDGKQSI